MDERALTYFAQVVATGSVREAARQLHISPSSISRKLQSLEQDLGCPLIERLGHQLCPTAFGRAVADFVERRRQQEMSLTTALDNLRQGVSGTVRVALGGGFLASFLAQCFNAFHRDYPGVQLQLAVEDGATVVGAVRSDRADIGMVYEPMPEPDISIVRAVGQPLHLLCPSTHPLADTYPVSLRQLVTYPLALLSESFDVRSLIDKQAQRDNLRLDPAAVCGSYDALERLALQCGLPTVLPRFCLSEAARGADWVSVPLAPLTADPPAACLFVAGQRALSNAASTLLAAIGRDMSVFQEEDNSDRPRSTCHTG